MSRSNATTPALIDERAAAAMLAITPRLLQADRSQRHLKIPFVKLGRLVRYDPAEIARWIDARRSETAA